MNTLLLSLALACGRGGPPEGHVPAVLDDPDSGTTGTTDSGTTSAPQGLAGLSGQGTLNRNGGELDYQGSETAWFQDADGSTVCQVDSQIATTDQTIPPCESCEWSLTLSSSGSTAQGCPGLDVGLYDGQRFAYGYLQGDGYGVLAVYYPDYGWYGVQATASYDAASGRFEYEWPIGYFSY